MKARAQYFLIACLGIFLTLTCRAATLKDLSCSTALRATRDA